MKYSAVIFDLFGTLVDSFSRPEYESVLVEMAAIVGIPRDKFVRLWLDTFQERNTGIHPTPQASIRYICRQLDIAAADVTVEQAARVRLDYTALSLKPRPGNAEVLTRLRSEGYKTGLISDCTGDIPMVWEDTELAPLFDVTVFSCLAGIRKPDPRIYRLATDRLAVPPQDCLYIGDGGSAELTGAARVGMHPVLLRHPDDSVEPITVDREEDWQGPVISTLQEVLTLLK